MVLPFIECLIFMLLSIYPTRIASDYHFCISEAKTGATENLSSTAFVPGVWSLLHNKNVRSDGLLREAGFWVIQTPRNSQSYASNTYKQKNLNGCLLSEAKLAPHLHRWSMGYKCSPDHLDQFGVKVFSRHSCMWTRGSVLKLPALLVVDLPESQQWFTK